MIQKKKPPIKAFLVLLGVLLVGGYYLSGLFTFPSLNASNYSDLLLEIFTHPFRNYYNDMTTIILGCALIGWVFLLPGICSITGIRIPMWSMAPANGETSGRSMKNYVTGNA